MKRSYSTAACSLLPLLLAAAISNRADSTPCGATNATLTFPSFADLSSFRLNGTTAQLGNPVSSESRQVLRLTDNIGQSGSAFLTCPIPLTDATGFKASFSAFFSFRISNPVGISDPDGQGADGIVFVVQTVSNNTGGAGGGIGYSDIPRSLGIEYDTWYNPEWRDPNGNHVGIDLGGDIRSVQTALVDKRMNDGDIWFSWVDYDGANQQLEVRLSLTPDRPDAALMTRAVDLVSVLQQPNAFVGFTSGTGAAGGSHDILSFVFRNTFDPVTTITNPPPGELLVTVVSPLTFNRQTGLFEETVRVSANPGALPPLVRLSTSGLPERMVLFNGTGLAEGVPFVQQSASALVSQVEFLLEYYIPNRVPPTTLVHQAGAGSLLPEPNPTGHSLQIDRKVLTGAGRLLVEFTTTPGRTYAIQYSSDLNSWVSAVPFVTAAANRTQWLDDGAPKTTERPAGPDARFYRVIQVANP